MSKPSSKVFNEINKFIHDNLEYYDQLSVPDHHKIICFVSNINKKYNISINLLKFIEMRNLHIYMLSKTKGTLANKYGESIYNDYKNNESIVSIASKYKLPPISILYQILIELKNETHNIDKLLMDNKKLPKQIQTQMRDIMTLNPILWIPKYHIDIYSIAKKINTNFEYNINLKNRKKPNILFDKEYTYKNISLQWIEVKYHMLYDNNLLLSDIKKILYKYNKYGKGLIVYSDIICSSSFKKKINVNINIYGFLLN